MLEEGLMVGGGHENRPAAIFHDIAVERVRVSAEWSLPRLKAGDSQFDDNSQKRLVLHCHSKRSMVGTNKIGFILARRPGSRGRPGRESPTC